VAQTFGVKDAPVESAFTVIVNHFKSKGSCPPAGDIDIGPGLLEQQARAAVPTVSGIHRELKRSGQGNVLVIGDLNAYGGEDPVQVLSKSGLEN
jgi:predicted extracellular nuclease